MDMKKKFIILALSACALVSCYGDYTGDYEFSAAFTPYQYDLRTFVYGEDVQLSFTAALAGIVNNEKTRAVDMEIDNTLLTADLSVFDTSGESAPFSAIDGLLGKGGVGLVSQDYVTNEVKAAGITELQALPEEYFTASVEKAFKRGRHTAKISLKPTSAMFEDAKMLAPYYALGFAIRNADVDSILVDRSFQIMVLKVENRFWGNWYHGGRRIVRKNTDASVVSDTRYDRVLPQADSKTYTLTTEGFNSVLTNKLSNQAGSLRLTFADDNTVEVEDVSGTREIREIPGSPSHHNGAKLIQDREIYLNYAWSNNDGTTTYVTDTLAFRNRIRDGINEWQDENTENYN